MIEFLAPALAACLLLACIHGYFGLHVLLREVIFVDLALAQIAALGAAVGHVVGSDPDSAGPYFWSLVFSLVGAGIFALVKPARRRVPQEAVIGIVYGVSAALVMLILSKSALDQDEIETMLTGRLLFVEWSQLGWMALVFGGVALLHVMLRRPFLEISQANGKSPLASREKLLDFVFYLSFAVAVTSSVQVAGVLVVFGLLIVPAACAALFFDGIAARLLAAVVVGSATSATGIGASALWDLPTGASVVAALGAVFALSLTLSRLAGAED